MSMICRSDIRKRHWAATTAVVVALAVLSVAGCSRQPDSPETQIRDLVARGEKAVEEKDVAALGKLVSERYRDEQGQDKRTLLQFVAYTLLRNQSIHLLTRIPSIHFPRKHRAEVTAFVAMASRPIDRVDQLLAISADLYRVDFTADEEVKGQWKVTKAKWRPAEAGDFR
jgi:hypothetical protein